MKKLYITLEIPSIIGGCSSSTILNNADIGDKL